MRIHRLVARPITCFLLVSIYPVIVRGQDREWDRLAGIPRSSGRIDVYEWRGAGKVRVPYKEGSGTITFDTGKGERYWIDNLLSPNAK